jgi:autotransporter-associated beta strand protein/predicted outer membrane repeat protein
MGSTVKTAWIAILLAFILVVGTTLDSNVLLAQDTPPVYTPGTRVYTHYWDGAGTKWNGSVWSSYGMWGWGVNGDAKGEEEKYFDNWARTDHIKAKDAPTAPSPSTFSQGGSPWFSDDLQQKPYDQVYTTTPLSYYFDSSSIPGYSYDYGFRADARTVVNDMYVSGPKYWFLGNGIIGNRLDLFGGAGITGFAGKYTFAYGVHWEAGNIEIFDSTNVFDQYTWSPNYNLTKLRNEWDPEQLYQLENPSTGYDVGSGSSVSGTTYQLTERDAQMINRDHNTIFVLADGLTIGKSNTIAGGLDYALANRFDVWEENTLNFYTPQRLSLSISGVNAFASHPGQNSAGVSQEFHVNGGAIYLRSGANIARSVVGSGSSRFGRFDLRGNYGYQGGAIYSDQDLTLEGNSLISMNLAARQGGAVFMAGTQPENTLTLDTTFGDIGFQYNYSFADSGNAYKKLNMDILVPDVNNPAVMLPTAYITNETGQILGKNSSGSNALLDYFMVQMNPYDTSTSTPDNGKFWLQVNTNDFFVADDGTPVKYLPRYFTYNYSSSYSYTTYDYFFTSETDKEYTTAYNAPKFYRTDSTGKYYLSDTYDAPNPINQTIYDQSGYVADYRQLLYDVTSPGSSYTYYQPITSIDAAWYYVDPTTGQIVSRVPAYNFSSGQLYSSSYTTTSVKYHYNTNEQLTNKYVNRWLPYDTNYNKYFYYEYTPTSSSSGSISRVYVDYKTYSSTTSEWYYVDEYDNILADNPSTNPVKVAYIAAAPTPDFYPILTNTNAGNNVVRTRAGDVVVVADLTLISLSGTAPVALDGTDWCVIDPVTGAFVNNAGTKLMRHSSGKYFQVDWDPSYGALRYVKADGTFLDDPTAANSGAQEVTDDAGTGDIENSYRIIDQAAVKAVIPNQPDALTATDSVSGDLLYTFDITHPTVTAQTVTALAAPSELTPYSDAIFLKQNTKLLVTGTHRVFMNDNITSDAGATELGGNSMEVDLTGTQANAFIQFGKNTDSLLNPSTKPGGQVTIKNGTLRILNGARFQTKGNDALFTVEANGIIAGGGIGGKSNPKTPFNDAAPEQVSGTLGAANGFIILGTISPDNFEFITPDDLTGVRWDIPTSDKIGYLNLWGNVTLDGGTLRVDLDGKAESNNALQTAFDKNLDGIKDVNANLHNSDIILIDQIQEAPGSGQLLLSSINKSKIDIATWPQALPIIGGKFVIAASWVGINDANQPSIIITNDNVENYFEPIIPQGVSTSQFKRRTAALSIAENLLGLGERDLLLQASDDGNVKLVWTARNRDPGGTNRIQTIWNSENSSTPYINWIRLDAPTNSDGSLMEIPLAFRNGDVIYFDATHNEDKEPYQVRPSESWSVGGMVIEGGTYNFSGGTLTYIRGTSKYSTGVNALGRLDITLVDPAATETNVTLQVHTDFEKGTRIGNFTTNDRIENVTVNLVYDDSLGKYDLKEGYKIQSDPNHYGGSSYDTAPLDGVASAQNERGAVYLKNVDAKIFTSVWGDNRTLNNHFELVNSNLTLEIPTGTELTIKDVDTSNSVLPNNQSHKGGAFYIDADSTLVRPTNSKLTLENNTAKNGGAIYAEGDLTIQGNTLFKGNKAHDIIASNEGRGGAIYLEGSSTSGGTPANVTLNTANGDIVFTGNTDDVTDSNNKNNNSLFLNEKIALQITGNNHVFFDDPIKSGTGGGNSSFTKTGTGIVQFQGENILNHQDFDGGAVNITGGTFRLAGAKPAATTGTVAEFYTKSINNDAVFNVTGATLAGQGSVIIVKGSAFNNQYGFNFSNAAISPDSAILKSAVAGGTAKLEIAAGEEIGMLTLEGSNVNLTNSKILIDIGNSAGIGVAGDSDLIQFDHNVRFNNTQTLTVTPVDGTLQANGEYKILEITSGSKSFIGSDDSKISTTDQLKQYLQLSTTSSSRLNGGDIELRNNGTEVWLVGFTGFQNGKLYWIGGDSASPNAWNTTVVNWQNGAPNGSPESFYTNDFVTFDNQAVTVNTNTVNLAVSQKVSGMEVTNGNFVIEGTGTINGVNTGNAPGANGKLTVGGGSTAAELTLGVETQFAEGTELKNNGEIVIANEKALGTYNHTNYSAVTPDKQGYVDVTGNGTIGTDAASHTINNRFNVAADKTLTVDVAAEKLTLNGSTASDVVLANNATLDKTGTGTLVFTGNKADGFITGTGSNPFTISATEGDIVFTTNSTDDAISNTTGTVTLTGNTGSRIYLGDTVDTQNLNLTGSVTTIVKANQTITGTATIGTGSAADKSVLYVASGNNVTATTSFDLKKYAQITGNGTITAPTINLSGTLNPSNDIYSLNGNNLIQHTTTTTVTTLNFVGATTLNGATLEVTLGTPTDADKINVTGVLTYGATNTIHITQFSSGTYDILTNNFALPSDIADHFIVDTTSQGSRNSYELQIKNDLKTLQLVSKTGGAIDLYWSANQNGSTDHTWYTFDTTILNWVAPEPAPNTPQYFQGGHNTQVGDTVNFNNENYVRSKNVELNAGDHVVRNMYVYGGGNEYTFNGEDNTSKISGTGDLNIGINKDGSNQTSGDATFNVELNFDGDVNIYNSAVHFAEKLTVGKDLFIDPSNVVFDKEVNVVTGNTEVADDSEVTYNGKLTTNQLVVTDTANVILNAENEFTNDTQLDQNATVTLGHNKGFGGKAVDVLVNADATIKTLTNLTIDTDIDVDTNAKLSLNTESGILTYKGDVTGTATSTLIKSGAGTAIFDQAQNFGGNTTISAGTLQLDQNYTTTGKLTIDDGATLTSTTDSVTVTATGGFDIKGTVKVEGDKKLNLAGSVNLNGATLNIKLADDLNKIALTATTTIDVQGNNFIDTIGDWGVIGAAGNDYYVLKANTQITGVTNSNVDTYFKIKNNHQDLGSRQTYQLELVEADGTTPGDNILKLHLDPLQNIHLYWEGEHSDQWNLGAKNWLEKDKTTETNFANGDYVTFQSDLAKSNEVDLSNTDHIVSGMEINDGNFFFYGTGKLFGNTTDGNYAEGKTGRLDITGNTGSVNISVATEFENGINITGNREIVIGNDEALGNAGKKVEIKNGSNITFKNDGENRKIQSDVTLEANTTLTVNTATNDLAFNGALVGTNTTFIKNGNGSVSFFGNNNTLDANGNATINAGTFRVEENSSFNAGNQFTLETGAEVAGNGKITATNIELAGNIASGTDGVNDGVGTLTFNGKTTFNGANLLIDLKAGNVSDKILVLNGIADISHANTVTIKNLLSGTYTIIDASQGSSSLLGDVGDWENILPTTKRASAELLKNGNLVQLTVNVDNLLLTWNGNAKDGIWDIESTQNWTNDKTKKDDEIFVTLDTVTFNGRGQGNVEVVEPIVTVADMNIKEGEYHFTGGDIYGSVGTVGDGNLNITGGETSFEQSLNFAGKLNVSGGNTTFTMFNNFKEGIDINGNAVVTQYGLFGSADGDFILGKDATLNFVPYEGLTSIDVPTGKVDIQGNVNLVSETPTKATIFYDVIVAEDLDQKQLHSKFDRTWGLNGWEAKFEDDADTSMNLLYEPITPYDFAKRHGLGWNMKEAARATTEIIINSAKYSEDWDNLNDYLHVLNTDEAVISVLSDLRGTEQAADALTIALWDPWTKVYQQLIKRDENTTPAVRANGQAPVGIFQFKNRNVWIESYYRYTDVNSDNNAKKYYENRGGLMLGLDTKVAYSTSLGIAFGFGDPKLTSEFGKVEADDYTLALYSHTRIHDYRLNTFFGFGSQEFKSQRNDWLGTLFGDGGLHKAGYSGNALYISAELLRAIDWSNVWTLYPTAALDYQRSWTYSFTEQGGLFGQSVRKGDADRFIGRVGLDSKFRYSNALNILTRLQAGYLVGGDTHTRIRSSFTGTTPVMSLHGVDLGRTQLNLGIGGEWFVDEIKSLKFFGNYDLDFGKRHAMQTLQLGAHVTF